MSALTFTQAPVLATLSGTGSNDVWGLVYGQDANGVGDPSKNHLVHHDGRGSTSVAIPERIMMTQGQAAAFAGGNPGELWLMAIGSPQQTPVVVVSLTVDGTAVDHTADFPPLLSAVGQASMVSRDGVVVASYGGKVVRFEAGAAEVLPDLPAGAFINKLAALNGRHVYAKVSKQVGGGYMWFDGTSWVDLPFENGPISISFAGPNDGWAGPANWGLTVEGVFPLYRFDGAWTASTLVAQGLSPLATIATGPNAYAVLGLKGEGKTGAAQYRTGTTNGLSTDNNSLVNVSRVAFEIELGDGSFLMSTVSGVMDEDGADASPLYIGDRATLD